MHLVYLDESGNSGTNLNDQDQAAFVLTAMIVDEQNWQGLESDLMAVLNARIPNWKVLDDFEVHGADLRHGSGPFKGMQPTERIAFRDHWMSLAGKHNVKLIHRGIVKKDYAAWLNRTFGAGIQINPHIAAFALVARCVDNYLASLEGQPRGMLISDDNKEVVADIEKSIRVLRDAVGTLRLNQIVEKGFFVDSSKSLPLQLCDLFALSYRKSFERQFCGVPAKRFDDSGIEITVRFTHADNQHDSNVIQWLTEQHQRKKEAARG